MKLIRWLFFGTNIHLHFDQIIGNLAITESTPERLAEARESSASNPTSSAAKRGGVGGGGGPRQLLRGNCSGATAPGQLPWGTFEIEAVLFC